MEPCIAETDGEGGAEGGDPGLAYPNNLSLGNLASFLPKPTLVYQPSYPRSTRLRPRWLLWCAPRSTHTLPSEGFTPGVCRHMCKPCMFMEQGS